MSTGVLPKQTLQGLFEAGYIKGVDQRFLNPASIDLPLSAEAYALKSIFLPLPNERVRDLVEQSGGEKHDLAHRLEVGVPYIIRIDGRWKLPPNVYGYANPKSSTGRVNLFCRVVADQVDMYDSLPMGWHREMWVLVRADSFPVKLAPGIAVSQMRLFDGKSFLGELDANLAIQKHGLIFDERRNPFPANKIRRHADSFILTLDVTEHFGWECRGTREVLDFSNIGAHETADFFQPISAPNGQFKLRKDSFYILSTRERVMVPPYLSAELRPIDVRLGEFRSHAAGYIDPGWGWGSDGSVHGRPITLEVIPREDMIVRHGQAIARLRYERMKEPPHEAYDMVASNYVEQEGPQLSKHFRSE